MMISTKWIIVFLSFILLLTGWHAAYSTELKEGDIIFQTSLSPQSQAIQWATHSQYSHMGIIFKEKGRHYVLEATQSVKTTPLDAWIKRGSGGHYLVKRLKNGDQLLSTAALQKMKRIGSHYLGKNYDLYFEWSDEKIYCSELVWKIYKEGLGVEIGQLKKFKDLDLSSPLVLAKLKERFGKKLPLEEPVISPASMFDSELLQTVTSL